MRIIIIEDEKNSVERLKRMLKAEHEIVGVCTSNAEVKTFFANDQHTNVDLILSDIQLGDGLSFISLSTVPIAIPIIFITAYDRYALQAFKFNSIDYLLKPIDEKELLAAIEITKEKAMELSYREFFIRLFSDEKLRSALSRKAENGGSPEELIAASGRENGYIFDARTVSDTDLIPRRKQMDLIS